MTAGLYLHGPPSTGKTALAQAVGRAWIERTGRAGYFTTLVRLLASMKESIGRHEVNESFERCMRVPLLILDDVGVGRGSDFDLTHLWDLVNERLINQRASIFTSNFSITELGAHLSEADSYQGPRIAWRLAELCGDYVIEMKGANQRVITYLTHLGGRDGYLL